MYKTGDREEVKGNWREGRTTTFERPSKAIDLTGWPTIAVVKKQDARKNLKSKIGRWFGKKTGSIRNIQN